MRKREESVIIILEFIMLPNNHLIGIKNMRFCQLKCGTLDASSRKICSFMQKYILWVLYYTCNCLRFWFWAITELCMWKKST